MALLASLQSAAAAQEQFKPLTPPYPTFGSIDRVDPERFNKLVPLEAKLERLGEGMAWTEGPVWDKKGGYLLFSDIPRNVIMKWKEGDGLSVFMKPAGYTGVVDYMPEPGTNGLLIDKEGRLIGCEHGDRRISRLEHNGGKRTLADNYQGKRLNSPNDGVLNSKGDLYFTDPPYGLPKRWDDPRKELDFCGVYLLRNASKTEGPFELVLLTKEIARPNGIALSPDDKTLYVAQSDSNAAVWFAFDVKPDGTLGNQRIFFDSTKWAKEKRIGGPDGLKIDKQGNLFATAPGGIAVFAPDGAHLGTIVTGERNGNCAWGDDGSTLYIMCDHNIARIKTTTKGIGF